MNIEPIILAGGPSRSPVAAEIGWPLPQLPLGRSHTLLSGWVECVQRGFEAHADLDNSGVRLLVGSRRFDDAITPIAGVRVHREARSHRGTGGAVRDALGSLDGSESAAVLLIEASAAPIANIDALFCAWKRLESQSTVCFLGESKLGRYCGVALCDRSLFDLVPEVGFFDFKEQLLPAVRSAGGLIEAVRVADRARRVRTRPEWLGAVQAWQDLTSQSEVVGDCGADWAEGEGDRSVISRTAVTVGATIVSSIVMDEAVVEPGALVARSVIGPGMRVPADTRVIDAILADPVAGDAVIRRSGASGTVSVASE